jgi:hypothetical protein
MIYILFSFIVGMSYAFYRTIKESEKLRKEKDELLKENINLIKKLS